MTDVEVKPPRSRYVDPGMFAPFMRLLKEDADTRLVMAGSVIRVLCHVKIGHTNGDTMLMLQETFPLLRDPLPQVTTPLPQVTTPTPLGNYTR